MFVKDKREDLCDYRYKKYGLDIWLRIMYTAYDAEFS